MMKKTVSSVAAAAAAMLDAVRAKVPLVHCITNYVTVNDAANALLAIGASPIMADDIGEAGDIASIASALVLNIGTLNERTIASMLDAGRRANAFGVPVVLDPVGAGASRLRNETVGRLLREVKLSVLRGNLSEISFIAGLGAATRGVDSAKEDEKNDALAAARLVAQRLGCTVAVTGAVDVVTDGTRACRLANGHQMLSRVTGTGCMTTALIGAFAGAGRDFYTAAAGGISAMSIAGELAYERAGTLGTGSFHIALIDALSMLDGANLMERMNADEAD